MIFMAEYFDIYDETGNHIGTALRSECHGNPALIHCTAHVAVKHPETGANAQVCGGRDGQTAVKRLISQGYQIKDSYVGVFEMDEKTFVKNATLKSRK